MGWSGFRSGMSDGQIRTHTDGRKWQWSSSNGRWNVVRNTTTTLGNTGPMPDHQWNGYELRFESDTGVWGSYTNLRGATGPQGPTFTGGTNQQVTNDAYFLSEIYYNKWARNDGTEGLYWTAHGNHFHAINSQDIRVRTGSGNGGLQFTVSDTTARGYIHATTSNEIGFLNSSRSWSFRCDNSGNVTATSNVTAYSDKRLKDNINTIENGLEKVEALRGVTYTRKDNGEAGIGVIAQEIQEVLPELVKDNGEALSVAYGNITGVLIEAVKELSARVKELEDNK